MYIKRSENGTDLLEQESLESIWRISMTNVQMYRFKCVYLRVSLFNGLINNKIQVKNWFQDVCLAGKQIREIILVVLVWTELDCSLPWHGLMRKHHINCSSRPGTEYREIFELPLVCCSISCFQLSLLGCHMVLDKEKLAVLLWEWRWWTWWPGLLWDRTV